MTCFLKEVKYLRNIVFCKACIQILAASFKIRHDDVADNNDFEK